MIIISIQAYGQQYKITGAIRDIKTNAPLSFSTIKIADSTYGTTSDNNGEYILKLGKGYHKLICSYIGYFTDTASIFIDEKNIQRDIFLKPTEISTELIEVFGEDPAYEIIRKAIKYKKEFKSSLNEYNYNAYSKFIIRTNLKTFGGKDTTEDADSSKLGIFGILESETKGYFKKPDLEKEIVISKKETANISRGFAIPLIVNFYDEKIDLGDVKIPGPLADDATDRYEYKLLGINTIDSNKIFKIQVTNTSSIVPQFYGTVYILDSIFALMKVNLNTNSATSIRGIDNINFIQKFTSFSDNKKLKFWMPTDVQIYADGSFAGIVKLQGEVYTVVSNYNLNQKSPDGIFDEFLVKVLPDAGKKDSAYWSNNQVLKNSKEEQSAFKRIENVTKKKDKEISIGLISINYGKYASTSTLDIYRFNKVEGSSLGYNLNYNKDFGRTNAYGDIRYGFSDKKTKYHLGTNLRLLNDGSLQISANFHNNIYPLFSNPNWSSYLENTFMTLFYKKEYYHYAYSNGYSLSLGKTIIPQIRLTLLYSQDKQMSAYKNTDYSFYKKSELYDNNTPINDAFKRSIGFELRLNPNTFKAIDWGTGEISRFSVTQYPTLIFRYENSSKNILLNTYDNTRYSFNVSGRNNFNVFTNFKYRFGGIIHTGTVPYQQMAYFNSSYIGIADNLTIYAMKYNEYLGDKLFYFNFENSFGKLIPGNLPIIKSLIFTGFFNAGKCEVSNDNLLLSPYKFYTTNGIYTEAGFGIDRILEILKLNFAWRLNNFRDGNNFNIVLTLSNF